MKNLKNLSLYVLLLGMLAGATSVASEYEIIDLGTFLGGKDGYARGINDSGQVVGHSKTASGDTHAFLWTESGSMQDLGTLGGSASLAYGINDSGQVVGWSSPGSGHAHAFLWTESGGMQDLGPLEGSDSHGAYGINDSGQVVGHSKTASGDTHAFLWTESSGMQYLGTLGGSYNAARGINDSGQVVGLSDTASGDIHAFLWTESGGMQDLGTLGGSESSAWGINDSGQVVGLSDTASGDTHAFLWTADGGMQDLGTLGGIRSFAYGINDSGQVVGFSGLPDLVFRTHAFLWTADGGMQDLGTLGGSIRNSIAYGINNSGQIVGTSRTSAGKRHACMWNKGKGKEFMITFDDGPIPGQTDSILLQLRDCKVGSEPVKAGFFVVGDPNPALYAWYDIEKKGSVRKHPDALREIDGLDHIIGNHTQQHASFIRWWWRYPEFKFMQAFVEEEISKCNNEIENALGKSPPRIFRAPYLQHQKYPQAYNAAKTLGFKVIGGEVADMPNIQLPTLQKVKEKAKAILESWEKDEPAVLIFHDNRSITYNHIGEIIKYLQAEGFTLVHFNPDLIEEDITSGKSILSGIALSPVDLSIADPDGLVLNTKVNQIPEATYQEIDIDGNGELDDFFAIPESKEGIYLIKVIQETDASPNDTFTLVVNRDVRTNVLAQDMQVQNIPDFPFVVTTLTSLSADMEIEPETLNLSSEGNWITCYIQFPEAYYIANIDSSTILLNGEIPPARLFAGDEEDIEQILMVKFDRSDLQKIIQPGNVELIVTGELLDGTPFECRDTIRVIDKVGKK